MLIIKELEVMKYIIAFDTICTGWDCVKGENEKPALYDSHDEAFKEIFGDALASWETKEADELEEYDDVTAELIEEMDAIYQAGDVKQMEAFFMVNPSMNYHEEFIVEESEYIQGRKTIFNG